MVTLCSRKKSSSSPNLGPLWDISHIARVIRALCMPFVFQSRLVFAWAHPKMEKRCRCTNQIHIVSGSCIWQILATNSIMRCSSLVLCLSETLETRRMISATFSGRRRGQCTILRNWEESLALKSLAFRCLIPSKFPIEAFLSMETLKYDEPESIAFYREWSERRWNMLRRNRIKQPS